MTQSFLNACQHGDDEVLELLRTSTEAYKLLAMGGRLRREAVALEGSILVTAMRGPRAMEVAERLNVPLIEAAWHDISRPGEPPVMVLKRDMTADKAH